MALHALCDVNERYLGLLDALGQASAFDSVTSCGGYNLLTSPPATGNIDVLNATGAATPGATTWTVSVEILKSLMKSLGRMSPNTWQICFASTVPFTTATGTPKTREPSFSVLTADGTTVATYYYGLLPACSSTVGAPCVSSTNKDKAGDVVITFLATGDAYNRW